MGYNTDYDSFEAQKLRKQIAEGKNYLQKLYNEKKFDKARALQDKIMFWQNDILPIVLKNTCLAHHEIGKYAIQCFDTAIKYDCNAVHFFIHIKDDYTDKPRVGIVNSKQLLPPQSPTAMQLHCEKVEILNMDGSGLDEIECYPLLIQELL